METPLFNHLTSSDYEHIYEPSEDTFLLLDALEADLQFLEQKQPQVCVEIGSGSGVIITALAKKLHGSLCFATDINLLACQATKRTAKHNSVLITDTINCSLVKAFRPHTIDLLVFNPPYVVTTDAELSNHSFDSTQHKQTESNLISTWAGGQCGRRIIDELLLALDTALSSTGVMYLLLLRENNPEDVIDECKKKGFVAINFMERRIPGEYLHILKISRQ